MLSKHRLFVFFFYSFINFGKIQVMEETGSYYAFNSAMEIAYTNGKTFH
jgi:hypothetical protein